MVNDIRNDRPKGRSSHHSEKKQEVELKIYVLLKGGTDIMKDKIK